MKTKRVILYPSMGVGHLLPMIQLAKQFILRGISVTVAVMSVGPPSEHLQEVLNSNPNISFHIFTLTPPDNPHPVIFVSIFDMLRRNNESLRSFLIKESTISPISGVILDMFCVDALDVVTELNIPPYLFFTCCVSSLAVILQLPSYVATQLTGAIGDMGDTPLIFCGVPPLPASHLPKESFDPETEVYELLIHTFGRLAEAKGILVNSFESLEPRAVATFRNGLRLPPPSRYTPPIYCIGPVNSGQARTSEERRRQRHPCLLWLDAQPKSSVVFLCFGSMGSFVGDQMKQIAVGLENSGQRFLWVVRNPPNPDPTKMFDLNGEEPDLDALLPEGFLARTEDRGMVVKQWAPQMEVLKHGSVAGFVSHCGWNSTLEAVSCGVPMICWPLYAEQKMNKVFLVEEMKIGVELKGYHGDGFVKADELEAKVKWIVESEGTRELRYRMMEMKEAASKAVKEGGSSFNALEEFLDCLK